MTGVVRTKVEQVVRQAVESFSGKDWKKDKSTFHFSLYFPLIGREEEESYYLSSFCVSPKEWNLWDLWKVDGTTADACADRENNAR